MCNSRFPAILLAFAALASCTPEQQAAVPDKTLEIPVLTARDANFSRTSMNPADYSVSWTSGDKLSVFNKAAGSGSWSEDLEFTLDDADAGRFVPASGVVVPFEDGVQYDWKAVYPHTAGLSAGSLPDIPLAQTQAGMNNPAHLANYDILYGEASSTRTPEIQMSHTGTLLKWTIKNDSEQPFSVSSLSFNNGTDTYVLSVTGNPEIAPSYSADFYMIVNPFSIAAGDELSVSVVTSSGTVNQIKTFSSAKDFISGKYNTATIVCNPAESPVRFSVGKNSDGKWRLYKNDEEFFINGVAANNYYNKVTQFGGNVIRTYNSSQVSAALAAAETSGVYLLVGLAVQRERDGFDFGNSAAIEAQKANILSMVSTYSSNSHVLGWIIGNELDSSYSDPRVWDVVEELASAIKATDPYHLTTTALAGAKQSAITEILAQTPSLDFISINSYYPSVFNLGTNLSTYGWNKPWIVSEFGPRGTWNLSATTDPPQTSWGACVEQTSTQKANIYKSILSDVVAAYKNNGCIGSCAFVWGYQTSGEVLTWYGLFDTQGYSYAAVDELQYAWTGSYPANLAPVIHNRHSMTIDEGFVGDNNVVMSAGSSHVASVTASSPCGSSLTYKWYIYPEGGSGANGSAAGIAGLINDDSLPSINFHAPSTAGDYRLLVFVRDAANRKVASASIPFYVSSGGIGTSPEDWSEGNQNW